MIVDAVEMLKEATTFPLVPTPTPTASVSSVPSVVPDTPVFQLAGDDGKRTLWIVFVVMTVASAAFTAMSWRIPVVRTTTPCGTRTRRVGSAHCWLGT